MFGSEAIEARDEFIYARIVFHGAGAERIHAEVDGVIPRGEAREVANHFDFADFWESLDAAARKLRAQFLYRVDGGHVERRKFDAALSRNRLLKNQAFILADMAAGLLDSVAGCFNVSG